MQRDDRGQTALGVTHHLDQFMVNEADLVANFKTKGKSADFQAVSDVTFKDFSSSTFYGGCLEPQTERAKLFCSRLALLRVY